MSYLIGVLVIFLLGLFSVGKLNKIYKLYKNDSDRAVAIGLVVVYALFWPMSLVSTFAVGMGYLAYKGSIKLLKLFEL